MSERAGSQLFLVSARRFVSLGGAQVKEADEEADRAKEMERLIEEDVTSCLHAHLSEAQLQKLRKDALIGQDANYDPTCTADDQTTGAPAPAPAASQSADSGDDSSSVDVNSALGSQSRLARVGQGAGLLLLALSSAAATTGF